VNEETAKAPDPIRRRKTAALSAMLGLSLLLGIAHVASLINRNPALETLVLMFQLAPMFAGFVWVHADSIEHAYQRSLALNIGIILLALVFIPVYFFRTRPEGKRAPPILGFFSVILACMAASMIGATVMLALNPGAALPGP